MSSVGVKVSQNRRKLKRAVMSEPSRLLPTSLSVPRLSSPGAFRCKVRGHMGRRSFSCPPKDSDCMTNHVHHPTPPAPQTTASLEWKRELLLQLCRVKLSPLPLLNYSIVGHGFKLSHSKPYGSFERLQQVMPSPAPALTCGHRVPQARDQNGNWWKSSILLPKSWLLVIMNRMGWGEQMLSSENSSVTSGKTGEERLDGMLKRGPIREAQQENNYFHHVDKDI